jgi:hypothetical protein
VTSNFNDYACFPEKRWQIQRDRPDFGVDLYFRPAFPIADCAVSKRPAHRVAYGYFFFFPNHHSDLLCAYLPGRSLADSTPWEMVVCSLACGPPVILFNIHELFHARSIRAKFSSWISPGARETKRGEDSAYISLRIGHILQLFLPDVSREDQAKRVDQRNADNPFKDGTGFFALTGKSAFHVQPDEYPGFHGKAKVRADGVLVDQPVTVDAVYVIR